MMNFVLKMMNFVEDRECLGLQETVTVMVTPDAPLIDLQATLADKLGIEVGQQLLRGFIQGGVADHPGRYWDLDPSRSAEQYEVR